MMPSGANLPLFNGCAESLDAVPALSVVDFQEAVISAVRRGDRVAAMFGCPGSNDKTRLYAVLAQPEFSQLVLLACEVGTSYPSLTPECPQVHLFEREIAEQWGVLPEGHPWLKPVRYERSQRDVIQRDTSSRAIEPGVADYFRVEGEAIHEVAVGPVHAGIIEPGHFRFQCDGEQVMHLEIMLGYQHRGVERAMLGGPTGRSLAYMQTVAGDTTIAHTLAYCQIVEALSQAKVPARAQALRAIALELERLANHTGDLGALAGDVGFLPTASYCGRLRGDFLNMSALICGSRFGRDMVLPGGVRFDLDDSRIMELLQRLTATFKDVQNAVELLWDSPSVMARFEETGQITPEMCHDLGIVGVPARACGVEHDVRQEFPAGIYRFAQIPISTWHTGDVFGRAYVRWLEIQRSAAFIESQLRALPEGAIHHAVGELSPQQVVVSLTEGWRGEVCHVASTDAAGRFSRYKIVDPSFHNWTALSMALRNEQISDFPLCNKSFNLSYCGHDL